MAFPILVETSDGQFSASLVGAPDVCVVGPTRAEAIAALQTEIAQRIARGELLSLEVEEGGISSLAGKFRADPTLREICEDAYKLRDAELRGIAASEA